MAWSDFYANITKKTKLAKAFTSLASFLLHDKKKHQISKIMSEDINKEQEIDEQQETAAETSEQPTSPEEESKTAQDTETENGTAQDTEDNTPSDEESSQAASDPLAEAQAKIEELNDRYLRKVAEFENYRKRTVKEKADLILNGAEKTIKKVLPIIDDLERAIANGATTEDPAVLREGIELIYKKLIKILEGEGLARIVSEDCDFSTDYHEAIAMVPGMGDDKKGKVVDCVETGYTLNGKVIRYAKVAVGQ